MIQSNNLLINIGIWKGFKKFNWVLPSVSAILFLLPVVIAVFSLEIGDSWLAIADKGLVFVVWSSCIVLFALVILITFNKTARLKYKNQFIQGDYLGVAMLATIIIFFYYLGIYVFRAYIPRPIGLGALYSVMIAIMFVELQYLGLLIWRLFAIVRTPLPE